MQILFERYPPEGQIYKNETGCKTGDKCLFPHYKVDERLHKKQIKSNISRRRESDDNNAVTVVKSVSQLGCVSRDSDALVSQGRKSRGKPDAESLGTNSKGTIHKVYATSCEYPGKRKDHRWENKCQCSSQRSPYAMKFEDRSREETERQQRCARSKAWNFAKNMYMLKEKDKAAFYFPAEEWVLPAASTEEPEEREFEVDSGASMQKVIVKDLNSAELETMRTSRSRTTVMTANGEV